MAESPPKEKTEVSVGSNPAVPDSSADKTRTISSAPFNSALPQVPDHKLLRCFGRGAYGEVWLARNVMGGYRAVKVVWRKSFDTDRPYEREFAGIQKFEPISRSHEGLVDILHVGRNDEAGYFFYVMELADDVRTGSQIDPDSYEAKTLRREIEQRGRLPIEECLHINLALTSGLGYLHEQGLVHRDIKPSNIIFVKGQPKLADIGLVCGTEGTQSYVGTEGYIPPEGPGTPQADIYSLGKVLYEMSTGKNREHFPDLPTDLRTDAERTALLELNEVLLKACAADVTQRYRTARDMESELALLHIGKSVKRNRAIKLRWALARFAAVLAAVAALVFAVLQLLPSSRRQSATEPFSQSIAVLPFVNMSSDKENEYFSDGVTDEIIGVLSKLPGLRVISRTSAFAFKGKSGDIQLIGQQLNVRTILEGSVKKAGNKLHILVTLINVSDGFPLWTQMYDRPWSIDDMIEIQSDVALSVATALKVNLVAAETRRIKRTATKDREAYENYLHGKYYTRAEHRGNQINTDIAIRLLEHAVELDTNFALAFAELGRAYVDRFFYFAPGEKEWETKARDAIERALSLDPNLAEAHFARAYFLWTPSQGFPHQDAIVELRRALDLDPQLEDAYFTLGLVLNHIGLLDEAMEVARQAALINPLDTAAQFSRANALLWSGRFQEAFDALGSTPFAMNFIGGSYRAWALCQMNKTNEAEAEIKRFQDQYPGDPGGQLASVHAILLAKTGETNKADQELQNAMKQRKGFGHFHHAAYNIASAYALMNDRKSAVDWFKKAVEDGFNCYPLFLKDHNLDSLREVQDFKTLLANEEKKYQGYKAKFRSEAPLRGRI